MIRKSEPGWIVLAPILCGWALAGGVRAEEPGFLWPAAGARLAPGTTVEVAWTPENATREFDEMELVLSLDGGRTFPLRVTREVSPVVHRLFWRVPALPTEHARLALRSGTREEAEKETIRFVGPEFAITTRPGGSLEELFRVRGEWRTRDALSSVPDPPEPSLFDPPSDEMRAAPAVDRAAEPPRSAPLAAGETRRAARIPAVPASSETLAASRISTPLFIPLRQ